MMRALNISFRLMLWLLLTADVTLPNLAIGLCIAVVLPHFASRAVSLKDWLKVIGRTLLAIPQAYGEAVEMMIRPHHYETIEFEPLQVRRTPGLIFLDIFRITLTPKSIVLKHHHPQHYAIHRISHRRPE